MKRVMSLVLAWVMLFSLAACSGAARRARVQIVTTSFPLYDWTRNIVGDTDGVEITWLMDSGVDPHSFQPTTKDLVFVSDCDVFVYVGGESDEWAEDALQDAFVRLWGRYQVRSEREAEALLTRTVRNVSIDQLRKRKTVPLAMDLPEERTENREALFRRVEEMVDTELTDLQRLIIRRHEYESVTLERIAEELGMQPPAVRMQLSRARKTIREQYRKRYHEE